MDSFDTAAVCEKSLRIPWRCISFAHWIQPRSWNLILSCSAISSEVAPLIHPFLISPAKPATSIDVKSQPRRICSHKYQRNTVPERLVLCC